MATRDWFTDCSALFMRHSCYILSAALIFAAWYANRIETQLDTMQGTMQQIQIDIAVIRGFRDGRDLPAPGGGVAMAEAKD